METCSTCCHLSAFSFYSYFLSDFLFEFFFIWWIRCHFGSVAKERKVKRVLHLNNSPMYEMRWVEVTESRMQRGRRGERYSLLFFAVVFFVVVGFFLL